MRTLKTVIRSIAPEQIIALYHFSLAQLGALAYNFPSRELRVIAVTGTKGKSSTAEMVNSIFEAAGSKTALLNSIRIKVAETSVRNEMRMSMPGRFFIQRFLRDAVRKGCDTAILEMTSEGARQDRHRAIELDALIFTNLAPEHIESHGSYQAYADAKFKIARQLARSSKRPRIMVANADDAQSARYLTLPIEHTIGFSLSKQEPLHADEHGGYFTFDGAKISVPLPGEFSLKNALAAATLASAFGIGAAQIADGIAQLRRIPGRAEQIDAGQDFTVVVDYAHTPDSLEAIYKAYRPSAPLDDTRGKPLGENRKLICVLGATGGGRDTWKRPVMGKLAERYCEHVILTNEDPYDEDPLRIVSEVQSGMHRQPEIVMDRRKAIRRGLELAKHDDAVLITGKGTDPCICGAHGTKEPWSDAQIAREELGALLGARTV